VDIINAIDILEHLKNIHEIFISFFLLLTKIIIILPNMSYYKFRINNFFTENLIDKYNFSEKKFDRHRSIPNYKSINLFIKTIVQKN
jgi:hypothetical protein